MARNFSQVIERHVKGLFDRFVTDFRCPGCQRPTVILWRWDEHPDGAPLFEPLTVLEESGDAESW